MSGEDVYDLAVASWCPLCEAPHDPCEPPEVDLRYTCFACEQPIEFEDENDDMDGWPYHPWCKAAPPATSTHEVPS